MEWASEIGRWRSQSREAVVFHFGLTLTEIPEVTQLDLETFVGQKTKNLVVVLLFPYSFKEDLATLEGPASIGGCHTRTDLDQPQQHIELIQSDLFLGQIAR